MDTVSLEAHCRCSRLSEKQQPRSSIRDQRFLTITGHSSFVHMVNSILCEFLVRPGVKCTPRPNPLMFNQLPQNSPPIAPITTKVRSPWGGLRSHSMSYHLTQKGAVQAYIPCLCPVREMLYQRAWLRLRALAIFY